MSLEEINLIITHITQSIIATTVILTAILQKTQEIQSSLKIIY